MFAMQSPKFPLKLADIKTVINAARLKSRWKEKVRESLRRQRIPDPIEHLDFHTSLDGECLSIVAAVHSGGYIPSRPIRLLVEKSKGLCRQIVIPSVADALVLQTISDALWDEIKHKAPSKNAFFAPDDHKFSQVIKGQSSEYGALNAWLAFQEKIFGFSKTRNYIVVTDIANYYDSISYDHLRNVLAELALVKEHSLDLLVYTLSHMLWQPDYMPRIPIGLPQMQLDAPRLLAHCFLFDIDRLLTSKKNIDYARYMDDIDVGVDTLGEAKAILRDLDLALQTRQVRLNSGKTRILSDIDAQSHFCIHDNLWLSDLEDEIDSKLFLKLDISAEKEIIRQRITAGLGADKFDKGNGEKILKRLINYARKYGVSISRYTILRVIADRPGVRQTAFLYWMESLDREEYLEEFRNLIASSLIVDDATYVDMATSLVNARLSASVQVDLLVTDICATIGVEKPWNLYSIIWILSKYGTYDQIMKLIETTTSIWIPEEYLSRLIGGLYPLFKNTPLERKYINIINRSRSKSAQAILDFYIKSSESVAGFKAISKFLSAPNPSLPNRISHSKFLLVKSILKSNSINKAQKDTLLKIHDFALTDEFYALI